MYNLVYSQVPNTGRALIVGELHLFSKFTKWVVFNKQGVRKFFYKQASLLSVYT